jgi:hypothetical protein
MDCGTAMLGTPGILHLYPGTNPNRVGKVQAIMNASRSYSTDSLGILFLQERICFCYLQRKENYYKPDATVVHQHISSNCL